MKLPPYNAFCTIIKFFYHPSFTTHHNITRWQFWQPWPRALITPPFRCPDKLLQKTIFPAHQNAISSSAQGFLVILTVSHADQRLLMTRVTWHDVMHSIDSEVLLCDAEIILSKLTETPVPWSPRCVVSKTRLVMLLGTELMKTWSLEMTRSCSRAAHWPGVVWTVGTECWPGLWDARCN